MRCLCGYGIHTKMNWDWDMYKVLHLCISVRRYVITQSCPTFNAGLAKPSLTLRLELVITPHRYMWIWLYIHAIKVMLVCWISEASGGINCTPYDAGDVHHKREWNTFFANNSKNAKRSKQTLCSEICNVYHNLTQRLWISSAVYINTRSASVTQLM